jgi:O-antigen/teichoic acid export membrane protein
MDDPDNKRFYSKLMTYFVFIVMFFVLGMAFFGKEIVKLFSLRQEYYDAYKVIPLLSFAILFNMIKDVAMIGLQITKKTSIIAWIVVGVSISGILLNFLLVPLFQNQGAAIARVLASFLFLALVYHYSQREYAIPYEVRKLVMMILIGALMYIPVYMVDDLGLAIRIIIKSGLIILFPFLLYLMGFFEAVEIRSLQGAWTKWKNPARMFANIRDLLK